MKPKRTLATALSGLAIGLASLVGCDWLNPFNREYDPVAVSQDALADSLLGYFSNEELEITNNYIKIDENGNADHIVSIMGMKEIEINNKSMRMRVRYIINQNSRNWGNIPRFNGRVDVSIDSTLDNSFIDDTPDTSFGVFYGFNTNFSLHINELPFRILSTAQRAMFEGAKRVYD